MSTKSKRAAAAEQSSAVTVPTDIETRRERAEQAWYAFHSAMEKLVADDCSVVFLIYDEKEDEVVQKKFFPSFFGENRPKLVWEPKRKQIAIGLPLR